MTWLGAILANLMPALAGAGVVLAFLGRPLGRHTVGFALAAGYVLGVGLVALAMWLGTLAGLADPGLTVGLLLFATTAASAIVVLRQRPGSARVEPEDMTPWRWLLWSALLGLLIVNGIMLCGEGLTRPVYPWDAWSAWLVKPRVWYELGTDIDFVSFGQWLASNQVSDYTNEAWLYPELLPRFQLWIGRWVGHWHEPSVLLPWTLLYAACLASAYHLLRLLHASALAAMVTCFLIGSIPILSVQIALPGLADIWIAVELLLFCACTLLAFETAERRWMILALAFLALAAATKLEGLVWLIICLPVLLFVSRQPAVRRYGAMTLFGLLGLWWLSGGFSFSLGEDLRFVMTPQMIDLPYLGRYPLAFRNNLGAFAESFLNLPNWHLTAYLLPPLMLWVVIAYRRQREAQGLAMFAFAGLGFMFLLFFMTKAAMWAESMTASNRLALQFVPAVMVWTGLLVARGLGERSKPAVERRD